MKKIYKYILLILFVFPLMNSPIIGKSSNYKILYYMDTSDGKSIPITIEVPNQSTWTIPNMSGNWSCNTSITQKILFLDCEENGKKKFMMTFDCSNRVTNQTNLSLYSEDMSIYSNNYQHLELMCSK